jgi:hypothetical protein
MSIRKLVLRAGQPFGIEGSKDDGSTRRRSSNEKSISGGNESSAEVMGTDHAVESIVDSASDWIVHSNTNCGVHSTVSNRDALVADGFEIRRAIVPTVETYGQLQFAYNFINSELCDGKLPNCLIVVGTGSRSLGYYIGDRFVSEDGLRTDKIALNFKRAPGRETTLHMLSTLAHEAKHLEQQHFGTPGRGRYHNLQWAAMMEAIGLIPSDTGKPGGRKIGDRVSHYIEPRGRFAKAASRLLCSGFEITWREAPPKRSLGGGGGGLAGSFSGRRAKFTCPVCGDNAWGKADLQLVCEKHDRKPRMLQGDER